MYDFNYISSQLDYDPINGLLFWKTKKKGRSLKNPAGGKKDGYIYIRINGKPFYAHRVAFLLTNKRWPEKGKEIDHINEDRGDNRIINLREASSSENKQNIKKRKNNRSGLTGVVFHKQAKKWGARIKIKNGSYKSLGLYENIEDAKKTRIKAEKKYFKSFAPIR